MGGDVAERTEQEAATATAGAAPVAPESGTTLRVEPTPTARRAEPYAESEKELEWYFCCADGDVGFRAQHYDGTGAGVWGQVYEDLWTQDVSIDRAHLALRSPAHRKAVRLRADVECVLWQLPPERQRVLRLGFGPFGAELIPIGKANDDPDDWRGLRVWRPFKPARGQLLALALETESLRLSFARAHKTVVRPQRHQLLEFINDAISNGAASPGKWVEEARQRRSVAVALYDVGRLARAWRAQAEREAYVRGVRERLGL